VQMLLKSPPSATMGPAAVLAVIRPSPADRNRTSLVTDPRLPKYVPNGPRETLKIGAQLPSTSAVRITANHFGFSAGFAPCQTIKHYHVHLYRLDRTGSIRVGAKGGDGDVAATEDARKTMQLMHKLIEAHPEWNNGSGGRSTAPLGYAYDTRSRLFTTAALPFPDRDANNMPCLTETVTLPAREGTTGFICYSYVYCYCYCKYCYFLTQKKEEQE
jgi:hypothetical protein